MTKPSAFKWKHYQPEMIMLTVRWYLRYNLSFRDLVEIMEERGLSISILPGVEAMHMIKKEQIDIQDQSVQNQIQFINNLFGLAA